MSEVLKKFGRYYLLDLIAQGGMAEIYRARPASADGGRRLLVIKRIQAGFGGNNEFQKMFESEIKVTMGFNHPNIVQLYDFGEENKQPYIAMELVDGKNIRQYMNRFREMKQSFPVEAAAFMMEQAAAGLFYAHTFKDKITGESLEVVHRDISPQNILIAYEGTAKVIDFGIAKATTNSEATRAGVIKGKPSYLAPEQISGEKLDGRTDQFALGAVFWEVLVGKKLFAGDNDLAVLKMIESCTTVVKAPSLLNPNVPKELDKIVMKMLSKQPSMRFNSLEEVSKVLRRFLITFAPDFSTSDLSQLSKELFNSEIVEDRKKVQALNEKAEKMISSGIDEEAETVQKQKPKKEKKKKDGTQTFVTGQSRTIEYAIDSEKLNQQILVDRPTSRPAPPSLVPGSAGKVPARPGSPSSPTRTNATTNGVRPPYNPHATRSTLYSNQEHEEESQKTSPFVAMTAVLLVALGVAYYGPQFGFEVPILSSLIGTAVKEEKVVVKNGETPMNRQPAKEQEKLNPPIDDPASQKKVKINVNIFPSSAGATVLLNGKQWSEGQPLLEFPANAPLEVSVEKAGFITFKSEFKVELSGVDAEGKFTKDIILAPIPMREPSNIQVNNDNFGYLTVFSTPSAEVTIYVDDKPVGVRSSPFQKIKIPAGKIKLYLYNSTSNVEAQTEFTLDKGSFKNVGGLSFKEKKKH